MLVLCSQPTLQVNGGGWEGACILHGCVKHLVMALQLLFLWLNAKKVSITCSLFSTSFPDMAGLKFPRIHSISFSSPWSIHLQSTLWCYLRWCTLWLSQSVAGAWCHCSRWGSYSDIVSVEISASGCMLFCQCNHYQLDIHVRTGCKNSLAFLKDIQLFISVCYIFLPTVVQICSGIFHTNSTLRGLSNDENTLIDHNHHSWRALCA